MKKPEGFNPNVQLDYQPVQLGGHKCVIGKLVEDESKSGQPMVIIALDFTKEDVQPGYMKQSFDADTRLDKKWPSAGLVYIMQNAYDFANRRFSDRISKSLNDFFAAVQQSNPGFEINWDAKDFGAQFAGKKVGAVYGEEENEYNGKTSMMHKVRYFCVYESALNKQVPKAKLLKRAAEVEAPAPAAADDYPF